MDEQQAAPQDYFTEDVHTRMRSMTEEDMIQKLRNMEQSEYWIAILKYNQMRLSVSQSALFIGDPVKEPAAMARQQGVMLGLSDLQNAVVSLVQGAAEEAKEAQQQEDEDKGTDVE